MGIGSGLTARGNIKVDKETAKVAHTIRTREVAVAQGEETLKARMREFDAETQRRREKLDARERALDEREAKVAKRENALKQKEKANAK